METKGKSLTVIDPKSSPKPNTSELLPLEAYDKVIISYSGGKDSLACLLYILDLGVPKDRIELWHQHVDGEPGVDSTFMDWPVTEAYCKATGEAMGIPVRFQWKQGGFKGEMLRENSRTNGVGFELADGTVVRLDSSTRGKETTRRKFPQVSANLSVRWCSAYLKIDVAGRAINNDPELKNSKILFVTGERREESAARARYAEMEPHRSNTKSRRVDQWRAIIDWTEQEVWDIIKRNRINPHPAYRLGWGRVSCMACIFADKNQWASIRELDPKCFNKVSAYESEFGVTIQRKDSIVEQADKGESFIGAAPESLKQEALGKGFSASDFFVDDWEMPSGAFKRCGGPT